jgi:tetratricopeptide (TPR) repeat protein
MYKNLSFLLLIILFSGGLFAQDWNEIYYLDTEAQYLVEENEYEKAIDVYRKMLKEVPNYSFVKYKIGLLYLKTDDLKNRAVEILEEASTDIGLDFNEKSLRETRAPADVLLYLGEAYQIQNNIDKATEVYDKYKNMITPADENYSVVEQRLKTCKNALEAFKSPERISTKNLGDPVNDENSNFGAVFSGDGNTLVFTSYTRNYMDNYVVKKENGVWMNPKKISENISGKYYLKTSSMSFDGEELYLTTDDFERNDLFVSYKEGKTWTEAEKLGKTINGKKSNETHACVSKDKNTIYYTSDREGGQGGLDIYKATRDAKGGWGEAVNLGPEINTPFDESTPFVTMDDKYLFFSSKGHSSIGGFDIFYIDLQSKSMAVNLGYPANTSGDDLFFVPDNSLTSGYISRYESDSKGKKDIYYISVLPPMKIAGVLKNADNNKSINDGNIEISIIDKKTSDLIETISSNNGTFNREIIPGEYTIAVNNENFEAFTKDIIVPEDFSGLEFLVDIALKPIAQEEELIAEVVEEEVEVPVVAVVEPIKEEPVIEPIVEEKPIVKEETVIEEKVVEEKVVEKPKPVEKVPEKEVVKYVPTKVTFGEKTYSVQLMALKTPIDISFFKNVDGIQQKKYDDGYYRYTVGNTKSYTEAQELKETIKKAGYKDAYIRVNNVSPKYTIQIMALIIPVESDYFKNLSAVVVTKGADDYYRYTVGDYNSYSDAKNELPKIAEQGYKNAYVKRSN